MSSICTRPLCAVLYAPICISLFYPLLLLLVKGYFLRFTLACQFQASLSTQTSRSGSPNMESDSSPDVERAAQANERTTLLSHGKQFKDDFVSSTYRVPPRIARRLYVSHFLSTWNSRVFEFGAVLYLAKIFPGTLLPMSVYAFARSLSALIFSSAIGRYIDENNRLKVVRSSISTPVPCPWFRCSTPACKNKA